MASGDVPSIEGRSIRVAFGSVPKDGGTFTFYRNIRPRILEHGIDLRCVSVGRREAGLIQEEFLDEGCVVLAPEEADLKAQARAFEAWCRSESIDIVIGINSEAILSSLPHLPETVRAVSRCANSFPLGYQVTVMGRERLARIVTTAPRQIRDLTGDYGIRREDLVLIPNGIEPDPFGAAREAPRGQPGPLRLGFLGRLEHNQKGVLYLPEILQALERRGVDYRMRIAGKGRHEQRLRAGVSGLKEPGRVEFLGALGPADVPGFLEETDVLVFPSRFEGCPNTLLEAVLAGCVPVSWILEGITDFILEDGRTGALVPLGDAEAAAERIARLASDRDRLREMSRAAAEEALKRFTTGRSAAEYAAVFREVMEAPPPAWTPRSWEEFAVPGPFRIPLWRRLIPQDLKRLGRDLLVRLGLR